MYVQVTCSMQNWLKAFCVSDHVLPSMCDYAAHIFAYCFRGWQLWLSRLHGGDDHLCVQQPQDQGAAGADFPQGAAQHQPLGIHGWWAQRKHPEGCFSAHGMFHGQIYATIFFCCPHLVVKSLLTSVGKMYAGT